MTEPIEINSREYWDERFHGSWQAAKGGEQTLFFAETLVRHLPDWFKQDVVRHRLGICDWGCAEGEGAAYLAQVFPESEVAGIDFSAAAIETARARFPAVQFIAEDWVAAESVEPRCDIVLTSNVLEHFREPLSVLRNVLGKAARKYIVAMMPYNENPEGHEKEHFFRFIKETIPFAWPGWRCLRFEVIDTGAMPGSRWRGQQALAIYAGEDWIAEAGLEATLDSYPGETGALAEEAGRLRARLGELKHEKELLEKKLEMQLVHDNVILNSSTRLAVQHEALREEHSKVQERLKMLQTAAARAEGEASALTHEKALLEQKLETQLVHDKILLNSNGQLAAQCEALRAEHAKGLERIKELETAAALAQARGIESEREAQALRAEAAGLREGIAALEPANRQLMLELVSQKELIQDIHSYFKSVQREGLMDDRNTDFLDVAEAVHTGQIADKLAAAESRVAELEQYREVAEARLKWMSAAKEEAAQKGAEERKGLKAALEMQGSMQSESRAAAQRQAESAEQGRAERLRRVAELRHWIQHERAQAALDKFDLKHQVALARAELDLAGYRMRVLDAANANLEADRDYLTRLRDRWPHKLASAADRILGRLFGSSADAPPKHVPPPPLYVPSPPAAIEANASEPPRVFVEMESIIAEESPPAMAESGHRPAVARDRSRSAPRRLSELRLGVILDKFTFACLNPICQLVAFRPDNWRRALEDTPIDLLFVESAWHGNDNAWEYRIGDYLAPPDNEFDKLLAWCREQGIPCVFWNKEDPPHFEKFARNAAKFDYIFTTDAHCIPKYRAICGHDRIAALPFAAQRRLHNPIMAGPRLDRTCFAGTYYALDFEDRRRELDILLRGGAAFGLDIFDRMHGYDGPDKAAYAFPEEFRPYIRGGLDYDEMVQAYRSYRVFLNVNSVCDSPTMFSRRVFELLACGTPVVTTRSVGVELMFGSLVPQIKTDLEMKAALERLFGDDDEWRRVSVKGVRCVMTSHTYTQRLRTVCETAGIPLADEADARMAVIAIPSGDAGRLARCLASQTDSPWRVFVPQVEGGGNSHLEALLAAGVAAEAIGPAALIAALAGPLSATPVAFMDSRHFYGPNYLLDARLSLGYTTSPVTGLSAFHVADGATTKLSPESEEERRLRNRVHGATVAAYGRRITRELLDKIAAGGVIAAGADCYARNRFEFLADPPPDASAAMLKRVCL